MQATPLAKQVQGFSEPRRLGLRLDPLLFLATLGLIAAGAYVVGTATRDDIPGDPHYYLNRQVAYALVGLVLMYLISRFDYSRVREWKAGIYATMIGLIVLVYVVGFSDTGPQR